jgi:hypothetical protein
VAKVPSGLGFTAPWENLLIPSSGKKMEAAGFTDILVPYKNTWCDTSQDCNSYIFISTHSL